MAAVDSAPARAPLLPLAPACRGHHPLPRLLSALHLPHTPATARSLSDPVMVYDSKPVEEYRPLMKRQPVPAPPLNVAVRAGPGPIA